jgi:hypothetical protein
MNNQVNDTGSGEPLVRLVIALSALLLFTASDYLVGICKLLSAHCSNLFLDTDDERWYWQLYLG